MHTWGKNKLTPAIQQVQLPKAMPFPSSSKQKDNVRYKNNTQQKITIISRDNIRTLTAHTAESIKKQHQVVPKPGRKRSPFSTEEQEPQDQLEKALPANNRAMCLDLSEFEKVKNLSAFLSKEELQARNEEMNNAKLRIADEAKVRRARMEEYDHKRAANEKLSELEQEAKDKANYLLTKAKLQLEEQEDEIKHLNELMLYAKCVAIRDVQVEEKKMIRQEKKREEARLDVMMEAERVAELKKIEEREKKRVEGASKIRDQIEERREAALLLQERRDQETKLILAQIAERNEEDRREKSEKVSRSRKLMQEVAKANQESMERKKQAKLAEEEEDRKVLRYILDKEARDIEKDKQSASKVAEREQELARLRAAQEKISDKQAQQDALRAQRAHETYEREWRKKEREAAEKKARLENELRAERIKQQESREHAIAVESHKLKVEFFDNLDKQRQVEEKIREEEHVRIEKNKQYSKDVKVRFTFYGQTQIAEKEAARRKEREEFFMEGIRLAKERKEKIAKIEQIKARKIADLQKMGVPPKYCAEIERKSHEKERLSSSIIVKVSKEAGKVKA